MLGLKLNHVSKGGPCNVKNIPAGKLRLISNFITFDYTKLWFHVFNSFMDGDATRHHKTGPVLFPAGNGVLLDISQALVKPILTHH